MDLMNITEICDKYSYDFYYVHKGAGDIHRLLPILKIIAADCERVGELGVRSIISSYALAAGLIENGSKVKNLWSNDIVNCDMKKFWALCNTEAIEFKFSHGNCLNVELPSEGFDFVFIDTWHVYGQLKRELARYSSVTRKYIAMHDTETDGEKGETIRMKSDVVKQSINTGIPIDEINKGLRYAIEEFLLDNDEWTCLKVYKHNNGLTVLCRTDITPIELP